jgi:tight adherence protein B
MRRLLLVLAVTLAALAAASLAGAAGPTPRLTELGDAHFPDRGYVLSLPAERTIVASDVHVTENGKKVTGVTVVPASALGSNEFGLALVIDASQSMRGEPIRKAMEAARAFAAQRQPDQQLGAVVFNARTHVVLPFTTDPNVIGAALAPTPPVAYYTRTFDALLETAELITSTKIGSASIVLLSDGRQLGSKATLEDVVAAARKAQVRIFTVALRSRSFDPAALQTLAEETGGFYTEARSSQALARIFSGLGTQLANEYFLHYQSLAGPGEKVDVKVKVAGFAERAISGYETPSLAGVSSEPYKPTGSQDILLSTWLMVLVSLVVAGLVALGVAAVALPRRSNLRARIGSFVSLTQAPPEERPQQRQIRARYAPTGEASTRAQGRWARWEEELEIAGFEVSARSIAIWTIVGTVAAGWFLLFVSGLKLASVLALVVPIGVRIYTKGRLSRKRRRFSEQLPDNLEVLASALRAGHSLIGSLSVVVSDAPEPSLSEFKRVVADEQLGLNLEDALGAVVYRMDNRDLDQVALVARLQRETGASSAEVLERVVENVRERQDVRRLVRTLTAQGRLSGFVLVGLPVLMLLFMVLFNRAYVSPLFTETLGRVMLMIALVMMTFGWLAIKKIIDIKV